MCIRDRVCENDWVIRGEFLFYDKNLNKLKDGKIKIFNENKVIHDENIDYDDVSESSTELCTFDDGVYGIPYMTECEVVMYNTEMFEKAGVTEIPTTFDELEAAAAA